MVKTEKRTPNPSFHFQWAALAQQKVTFLYILVPGFLFNNMFEDTPAHVMWAQDFLGHQSDFGPNPKTGIELALRFVFSTQKTALADAGFHILF